MNLGKSLTVKTHALCALNQEMDCMFYCHVDILLFVNFVASESVPPQTIQNAHLAERRLLHSRKFSMKNHNNDQIFMFYESFKSILDTF